MRLNPRFTAGSLRQHPAVMKAFLGLAAGAVWALSEQIHAPLPAYEAQRLERANRQRGVGGGRACDQPRVIRGALGLTARRLHGAPEAGARRYGATPAAVARARRRLLPGSQAALPCPAVGQPRAAGVDLRPEQGLQVAQVAAGRALSEATAQRVSRPTEGERRPAQYAGQKRV
jgi:hypothetical protein